MNQINQHSTNEDTKEWTLNTITQVLISVNPSFLMNCSKKGFQEMRQSI